MTTIIDPEWIVRNTSDEFDGDEIVIYGPEVDGRPAWKNRHPYSQALHRDLTSNGWDVFCDRLGRLCATARYFRSDAQVLQ